ncbi:MAG TPA: M20/M25/M40 family metallo-hydrolase [Candidatus Sulfomarinibacteraceae bacterium]|nr:M20/M25/M40 family metallo-hydrolase [Candidatus Sulfomarinibacteraceae bacterium]
MSLRRFTLFLFLMVLGSGCALLEPPPQPTVPTVPPPPTPDGDTVDFDTFSEATGPGGTVTLAVDPDVAELLNNISRQNLFAYVRRLESFGTRHTLSETERDEYGIGAARRWIYDEFNRVGSGRLQVSYNEFPLTLGSQATVQQNVVATLPGNGDHPGVIVLMAHYDSRGEGVNDGQAPAPGANDNGSGVAVLLEAARLLSAREWSQTIIFVAFAAEEQGTHGSRHFVTEVMLDGMIIDAAINNDIVGGRPGIPQAVRAFAPGPEGSRPIQLARYMGLMADLYSPIFTVDIHQAPDRENRYSDHREFLNVGVPAVRLTESVEDFSAQHNEQDTSDKIDYEYLVQVTRLNVAALANLAGAPPLPPPPTAAEMADEGSYLLTWPVDERAAGYAVAARPVGSHDVEMRFIGIEEAGNVAITGLDPSVTYNISLAALDERGRISFFSPEIIIGESDIDDEGDINAGDSITTTGQN